MLLAKGSTFSCCFLLDKLLLGDMDVLRIDATNGNALQVTFYKFNFVCLELSVCGFARQNMLWCGIDCQFYQLGLVKHI